MAAKKRGITVVVVIGSGLALVLIAFLVIYRSRAAHIQLRLDGTKKVSIFLHAMWLNGVSSVRIWSETKRRNLWFFKFAPTLVPAPLDITYGQLPHGSVQVFPGSGDNPEPFPHGEQLIITVSYSYDAIGFPPIPSHSTVFYEITTDKDGAVIGIRRLHQWISPPPIEEGEEKRRTG